MLVIELFFQLPCLQKLTPLTLRRPYLLANDDTEFRVRRCILGTASALIDMFTLPQPPSGDTSVPVAPVSELRQTLGSLLRFIYPIQDPPIPTWNELNPILRAAFKYDFCAVI